MRLRKLLFVCVTLLCLSSCKEKTFNGCKLDYDYYGKDYIEFYKKLIDYNDYYLFYDPSFTDNGFYLINLYEEYYYYSGYGNYNSLNEDCTYKIINKNFMGDLKYGYEGHFSNNYIYNYTDESYINGVLASSITYELGLKNHITYEKTANSSLLTNYYKSMTIEMGLFDNIKGTHVDSLYSIDRYILDEPNKKITILKKYYNIIEISNKTGFSQIDYEFDDNYKLKKVEGFLEYYDLSNNCSVNDYMTFHKKVTRMFYSLKRLDIDEVDVNIADDAQFVESLSHSYIDFNAPIYLTF